MTPSVPVLLAALITTLSLAACLATLRLTASEQHVLEIRRVRVLMHICIPVALIFGTACMWLLNRLPTQNMNRSFPLLMILATTVLQIPTFQLLHAVIRHWHLSLWIFWCAALTVVIASVILLYIQLHHVDFT